MRVSETIAQIDRVMLAVGLMASITALLCLAAYWLAGGSIAPDYEHVWEDPEFIPDYDREDEG